MNPIKLKENSGLSHVWAETTLNAFAKPDQHMDRLCDLSAREQWRLSDMDWESIDLSPIPRKIRQAAADMFTQIHYGEVTALLGAARMVEVSPTTSIRLFSSMQVDDEARHVQWFSTLMQKLDCRSEVLPSVAELMNEVFECDTLEELVVGVHILVEGMAHSFFMEGARASANLGVISQFFLGPYKPVKTIFAQWLPNFLGKDESRHLAFGVHFLSERIKNFTPAQRNLLESKIVRWGELLTVAVQDPKLLAVPNLDSVAIRNRCINNINLRLAKIGFEARIPTQS